MEKEDSNHPLNKLFDSIEGLLADEKEQKLRSKLGKEILNCIFTNDIIKKLNESDFSGLVEEEEELTILFSLVFPVSTKKNDVIFRLYKHKIEIDLSNAMSDRYIYMFSDGRLTSGLFQCYKLYDKEYAFVIKKIINAIPDLKDTINVELDNLSKKEKSSKLKIQDVRGNEIVAEQNFKKLMEDLNLL